MTLILERINYKRLRSAHLEGKGGDKNKLQASGERALQGPCLPALGDEPSFSVKGLFLFTFDRVFGAWKAVGSLSSAAGTGDEHERGASLRGKLLSGVSS